ncbi:MAG: LamG domain-containing protein, partial [DPANN group archaeon]|nr:LamG domain-containing protein [DPANN group archaeon]
VTWSEGLNTIRIYANDSAGNQNTSAITFRLDTTEPKILLDDPLNTTYKDLYNYTVNLRAAINDSGVAIISSRWYNLNNGVNNTFTGNTTNISNTTTSYDRNGNLSDLLAWYKLDNNWSTQEDSANGLYNATVSGAVFTNEGKVSGAYSFDGINDVIDLSSNLQGLSNVTFSVSAWIFMKTDKDTGFVYRFAGPTYTNGFGLGYRTATKKITFEVRPIADGSTFLSGNTSISLNIWHHVAGVFNGTARLIYLDGILDNSSAWITTFNSTSSAVKIGAVNGGSTVWFINGSIDEVRIYNRSLSAQEIQELYYVTNPTFQEYPNITVNATITDEDTSLSNLVFKWIIDGIERLFGFAKNQISFIFNFTTNNVTLYVNDSNNYLVSQYWNVSTDFITPLISFVAPTENNHSNFSRTNIIANVSITEANFANITFRLHNSTSQYNVTTFTTSATTLMNWTNISVNGLYYYNVTIIDQVGNINNTETRAIRLDTENPQITIVNPANTTYRDQYNYSYALDITYSDSGAGIQNYTYSLNGGANNTFTPNTTLTGLIAGSNNIYVTATDYANNKNTTTLRVFYLAFTPKINNINISNTTNSYSRNQNTSLSDGLVGWWSFDENRTDVIIVDKANIRNATKAGSPNWTGTDSIIGGAFNFTPNRNNNRIQIGNVAQYPYGNISDKAFTIIGWARRHDTVSNSETYLISNQRGNSGCFQFGVTCSGFSFVISPTQIQLGVQVFNSSGTLLGNTIQFTTTFSPGTTWHHYAVSHNGTRGTNATIYIDGVNKSMTVTGNGLSDWVTDLQEWGEATGETLTIGENPQHSGPGFNGTIDEVRIYNRSLSAQEISDLYYVTNPTFQEYPNITVNATITDEDTSLSNLVFKWIINGIERLFGFAKNQISFIFNFTSNNITLYVNDSNNYLVSQYWNVSTTFINPLISFTAPTENNHSNFSRNYIIANVSITEANFANITFRLHNSTSQYNVTTFTSTTTLMNWSNISTNGLYYYNVTIIDQVGNINSTETRTIRLDTTIPTIIYNSPTESNNSYLSRNFTHVNITA